MSSKPERKMKIKFSKYLIHLLMLTLLISIELSLPGCEDSKEDDVTHTVEVYTPTNNHKVVVQIFGVGSMSCAVAGVILDDAYVEDAGIKLNGYELTYTDSSNITFSSSIPIEMELKYQYDGNQISFAAGTEYVLEATHQGNTIASGTAFMPSSPEITNIESPYNHSLNTALTIEWDEDEYTTLYQFTCQTTIEDEDGNEIEKEFEKILSSAATSITIPDTFFSNPGEYLISITAIYGIDSTVDINQPDTTKGYNIEGPIGSFIATAVYPSDLFGDGFVINITDSSGKTSSRAIIKKSYKDFLLEKMNRFNNQF